MSSTEKILVLAYPGIGKTYLAENFSNVVDFEMQRYAYTYDKDVLHLSFEKTKSMFDKRKPNLEWPGNLIKDIGEELKGDKVIVTCLIPKVYKALCEETDLADTRIVLVIFDKEGFGELIDRYRVRGNTEEYIGTRKADFANTVKLFEADSKNEKVIVKPGEFLAEALIAHGIKLTPGKGTKNYF